MLILRQLRLESNNNKRTIYFGKAETKDDLLGIFKLRYDVYSQHDYIDTSKYTDGLEKDKYDQLGKCHYFIAVLENKVIGCIRVIIDDPLPTEVDFLFSEPEALKEIPRNNRSELGRFIIIPPNKENKDYLPRGLIMLFLLDVLSSFGLKNNLLGGYAFIKKSLEQKMKKMRMPIGKIENYQQRYPEDGVLYKYFNQLNDPVVPIYFITRDFYDYSERHIKNSFMFRRDENNVFTLRENIYTDFLKALKII